jgi:hypothetical protein
MLKSTYYLTEDDPEIAEAIKNHATSCDWNHSDECPFLYDLHDVKSGKLSKKDFLGKY